MDDLPNQLDHAYRELRRCWSEDWAGLARVVAGAVQWLCGYAVEGFTPIHEQRLDTLSRCAQIVEDQARQQASLNKEPPYHNRLHIADTVVGMASLLKARRLDGLLSTRGQSLSRSEFLCLAAMLIHDFGHDGRVNEFPRQIEQASVDSFGQHVSACGLSPEDWTDVRRLILETDPRFVGEVHARVAAHDLSPAGAELSFEEMAVLVVEADVLASALEFPGEDLTLSLIQEWAPRYPERAQQLSLPQGRLGFLRFGARFSSASARRLGIPERVEEQIMRLT